LEQAALDQPASSAVNREIGRRSDVGLASIPNDAALIRCRRTC